MIEENDLLTEDMLTRWNEHNAHADDGQEEAEPGELSLAELIKHTQALLNALAQGTTDLLLKFVCAGCESEVTERIVVPVEYAAGQRDIVVDMVDRQCDRCITGWDPAA